MHVLDSIAESLRLHLAVEEERIRLFEQTVARTVAIEGDNGHREEFAANTSDSPETSDSDSGHEDGRTSQISDPLRHQKAERRNQSEVGDVFNGLLKGIGDYDQIRHRVTQQRRQDYQEFLSARPVTTQKPIETTNPMNTSTKYLSRSQPSSPRRSRGLFEESDPWLQEMRKQQQFEQYRRELDEQIKEKQRLRELERRRQEEEDEKWNRKIEEQRKHLKREFDLERMRMRSLSQFDLTSQSEIPKCSRSPTHSTMKEVVKRQTKTLEVNITENKVPRPTPRKSIQKQVDLNRPLSALSEVRRKMQEDQQKMLLKLASIKKK